MKAKTKRLPQPKRNEYERDRFGRNDWMLACQLVALANLAMQKGATEAEIKEVIDNNHVNFVGEPVLEAIKKLETR